MVKDGGNLDDLDRIFETKKLDILLKEISNSCQTILEEGKQVKEVISKNPKVMKDFQIFSKNVKNISDNIKATWV